MQASIQKIREIRPIEGADNIEVVKVLGWECVTQKSNNFKPGDLVIYIEIDTVVPEHPVFEFLRDKHFRVRTIKLKGQVSQGLVLPLDTLGEFEERHHIEAVEGFDVSKIIGATHYEKPVDLPDAVGSFPGFMSKTDELNIQSEPRMIEELWGRPYYITKKIDGTSATFYNLNQEFGVCSRNLRLKDGNNRYWNIARKYDLERVVAPGIYFQGEIAGPGIQSNHLGLKELELFIFNIRVIEGNTPVTLDLQAQICEASHLQMVPYVAVGANYGWSLENLQTLANTIKYANNSPAEGIVVRPMWPQRSKYTGDWLSFKVLSTNYLLKNKE